MLALIAIAAVTGILTTKVFRLATNPDKIRASLSAIYAHLLEFRLFFDEPRLIWLAQVSIVRESARLLTLLLPPTLILVLPMTYLFWQLDAIFGHSALKSGEPAVVTAKLITGPVDLQATGCLAVETPPIRLTRDNQIVWRVRQTGNAKGSVSLEVNGQPAEVRIEYPKASPAWMFWFAGTSTTAAITFSRWLKSTR